MEPAPTVHLDHRRSRHQQPGEPVTGRRSGAPGPGSQSWLAAGQRTRRVVAAACDRSADRTVAAAGMWTLGALVTERFVCGRVVVPGVVRGLHRLACSASGTSGSNRWKRVVQRKRGAMVSWDERWRTPPEMKARRREGERLRRERLDLDVVEAENELAEAQDRLANEQAKVARLNELTEQRSAVLRQVDALQRERVAAEIEARAVEKRLAYQQRRVERPGTRRDGPRRGRAVRIEVDDQAWATVKREAVRHRRWLVWWLGDLIRIEVEALVTGEVTGTSASRRRRSPGEGEPTPRRRFVRIDVSDDVWLDLRAAALDHRLSVGRYVGELAEAVAYEAGWRATASQEG